MKPPEFYRGREQTYLKHFVLEKYLERASYNIFSFRDEFVYVDGFSGPWESADQRFEDTSFMIALRQLRTVRDGLRESGRNVRVRCFFNDNNPSTCERLREAIRAVDDMEIEVSCQNFEDAVPEIVAYVASSFSLTFIDPSGWTGFGLKKIQPVLKLRGEVIVNFMLDYVKRFFEHPRPELRATFDTLFGRPDWRTLVADRVESGETREEALLQVYRDCLREFGKFKHATWTRIQKPLADGSYFYLMYGTRHWKGLVEFRDIENKALEEQD